MVPDKHNGTQTSIFPSGLYLIIHQSYLKKRNTDVRYYVSHCYTLNNQSLKSVWSKLIGKHRFLLTKIRNFNYIEKINIFCY